MILISPAKRLQTESFDSSLNSTKPLFAKEADLIASELINFVWPLLVNC